MTKERHKKLPSNSAVTASSPRFDRPPPPPEGGVKEGVGKNCSRSSTSAPASSASSLLSSVLSCCSRSPHYDASLWASSSAVSEFGTRLHISVVDRKSRAA